MPLIVRLLLITFSILLINALINGHISCFFIDNDKPEIDSMLQRILVTIWCIIICLTKKQYRKLKDAFSLLNSNSFKMNYSLKRISYIKNVRFKVIYCVLWIMLFFSFSLIIVNIFNLNYVEMITKNYLYYQLIIWFSEAFLLSTSSLHQRMK